MPRQNLHCFLDRLNLRSILLDEEQQAVLDLPAYAVQVPVNVDHVALDEVTDHASLVISGMLGRFGQNARGDRQITALHLAGDMANLQSVVEPRATSALQALATTTVLRVPHHALRQATARYPAVAEALWRDCMVDAAVMSQWVVNLGRRNAEGRVAHLLCETAVRLRAHGQARAVRYDFPLTQSQLADAIGMTTVHVNRTLRVLKDVVTLAGRAVHIHDWEALCRRGDFNAAYLQADIAPAERVRLAGAGTSAPNGRDAMAPN